MSGDEPGSEPEDTMPFTHRPYGSGEPDNPFTSPSGTANQPSGPEYVAPGPGDPPMTSPPPYGPPMPGQPQWQQAWAPAYGAPYPGSMTHKGANASLILGIIALVALAMAPFLCCVTLPVVLCAPFAWGIGASARRQMDASPGVYGNRGSAQAGMIMGIVCTLLGIAAVLVVVGFGLLSASDFSLV